MIFEKFIHLDGFVTPFGAQLVALSIFMFVPEVYELFKKMQEDFSCAIDNDKEDVAWTKLLRYYKF